MHLPSFLLLATSWLPAPGSAGANQNVLARTIESPSSSSLSPPPPPPPPPSANSSSSPSTSCPLLTPQPLTIAQLSSSFPPPRAATTSAWDLAAVDAIKHALTLYAFAIDGRDWDGLDHVFAPGATADYGAPIGVLTGGRDQIKQTLPPYLTVFAGTQHVLGTQVVSVCDDGGEEYDGGEEEEEEGRGRGELLKRNAVSVTYFTAAHFKNGTEGKGLDEPVGMKDVMYAYGQYQDRWGVQEDGTWKIEHRNLVYMGPFVSETS
ncbi:hypothetical protein DIS24_g9964 [Lasiodiplodia hormozganensis]|uniref:SnoaL-like domain-containing protein n=1 Tax=Lasiodiplodia hormozganensis TaxID=869390 RepID=A0AA40CGT1_9PEZI|nr:hypothetical protein DIS24_g9964 [Lasiodiplodia hormozganensis]